MSDVFSEVVQVVGSIKALSERLNESLATVCNWRTRGIPANRARSIEALTGISVRRLRPNDWHEYWPDVTDQPAAQQEARDAA